MKTLVRCFLTFALLAVTILPMLTHNSSSPQQTAFRSGADIYMDGPVPIPPINRQRPAASSHFIALRPGAEIYMDGPVPSRWLTTGGQLLGHRKKLLFPLAN